MSGLSARRMSADERLRRLLAIVPWVVAQDGPTLDEVCARFDITKDELLADLDLLFLCGVYPFTPDTLMEVTVEDDRVWISYADFFARPLRLTPEEGLLLVASGTTFMAATGADEDGALAKGLGKLANVLGIEPGETIAVDLGRASPEVLTTLRHATEEHRQVEIDYYVYGRDERTRRVIEPHAVFVAEGEWYLNAWCTLAQALRRFRVDRIRSITVLERLFDPPENQEDKAIFQPHEHDPRMVIELAPAARWVIEQYPIEQVAEVGKGRLRVTLAIGEQAWLERLLLRLGPHAQIIDGPPDLANEAAKRVLHRYLTNTL